MGGLIGSLGRAKEQRAWRKWWGKAHVEKLHAINDPASQAQSGPLSFLVLPGKRRCRVHGVKDRCWKRHAD